MCDVCGFKFRAFELRRRYDGALVCGPDWEPRHPQDYVRGVPDHSAAPVSNPEQPDSFVPQTEQDPITGIPIISGGQPVKQAEPISTADIGIDEYKD